MDLRAKRVNDFSCGGCGFALRAADQKPMRQVRCPGCGTKLTVPGRFDHFLLARAIRVGSSGTIFKAFDDKLHRQVALKILRGGTPDDRELAERCLNSGRQLATVNHPNIAYIYGIGRFHDQDYIVKELVTSGTIEKLINQKQPMDEAQAIKLTIQIASGLEAAVKVGLIHKNIKPGNVLLAEDGTPKLIEFSTARVGERDEQGGIIGTPYYMAPELLIGRESDLRSDIYSLGVCLFYLLAKRPPFRGRDVLKQKLQYKAPSILRYRDNLHDETAGLVAKMLRANPKRRFQNYTELASAMRLTLKAVSAGPVQRSESNPSELSMLAMAADPNMDSAELPPPVRHHQGDTAISALQDLTSAMDDDDRQRQSAAKRPRPVPQPRRETKSASSTSSSQSRRKQATGDVQIATLLEEDMQPAPEDTPQTILQEMADAKWIDSDTEQGTTQLFGEHDDSMEAIIKSMEQANWDPPEEDLVWEDLEEKVRAAKAADDEEANAMAESASE